MVIRDKSQISMEYLIIVGFATFVILSVLSIAFFYGGVIRDKVKTTQINNFANKVLSTAESVYYYGEPSKATISVYMPDNILNIDISSNALYIEYQTSTGTEKNGFFSKVPISGNITASSGVKRILFLAEEDKVSISKPN